MRFIEGAPAPTTSLPDRSVAAGPRSLRILMVVESAGGGTGRHVLDLSEGLVRRGCEVHVIYSTGRIDAQFLAGLSRLHEVRRLTVPMRTSVHPSDWSAVRAVRRYARAHGPFDILHGHSSKGGAVARLAAFGTRAAAFYTLHGLIMMDPGLPRWKWLTYLTIELGLARRTSRVIAVSPEEARAAIRLGFGQSRVALIPNGVRDLHLTPRAEARRSIGAPDDALLVGFVGRLVEQKAPEILIHSIARAVKTVPHARLVIVGAGPLEPPLRDLAKQLHVNDKIDWLGECDARQYLAAFDAFALPSRKEGLPYVVLEAMAAGLPVVATDSAGVEILVRTGENGTVVPRDDTEAFGWALTELLADADRLARYASASSRRAQRFTVEAMVDRTLATYRGEPVAPFAE